MENKIKISISEVAKHINCTNEGSWVQELLAEAYAQGYCDHYNSEAAIHEEMEFEIIP